MNIPFKYFIIGALFGLCFPLGALIFEFQRLSLPLTLANLAAIHADNLILYMIDSAPLFLGLFAMIGGFSKQKSIQLIEQFKDVADFLSQNTEALRQHSENTLLEYAQSVNKLTEDYSAIDHLNRSTFSEISHTLEGTSRVSTEIDNMKGSLDSISGYHSKVGDNHKEIKSYLTTYLKNLGRLNEYFNYLHTFSREIEMLAVNSSIEANKHGAQGKAFMVFAQNIQKLAQDTKARNTEILKLMGVVSEETTRLGEIIDLERDNIQKIINLAADVNRATAQFDEVIRGFVDNLQEATMHLNQQNHLTSNFGQTLDVISGSNHEIMNQLKDVVQQQIQIINKMDNVTKATVRS